MGVGARAERPPKAKKAGNRTALEKLAILKEVENSDDPPKATRDKLGVNRISLWRWQKQRADLEIQAADDAGGSSRRILKIDPLWRVKEQLQSAMALATQHGDKMSRRVLRCRALASRDHLLDMHEQETFLSESEVKALKALRANDKWCSRQIKTFVMSDSAELDPSNLPPTKETLSINGAHHETPSLYYNPIEVDLATRQKGVMRIFGAGRSGSQNLQMRIHEWTMREKGNEGWRPRPHLCSEVLDQLNPPLVDNSTGDVQRMTFRNARENIACFAHKGSTCEHLQRMYQLQHVYREQIEELVSLAEADSSLWNVDCLAGGKYLPGGVAFRSGVQGSNSKRPHLIKQCAHNVVKKLHKIFAEIAGVEALILAKYCPREYNKTLQLYSGGEDCIYPTPAAQHKGQTVSEGLFLCLHQVALRVMGREESKLEQLLRRVAIHVDSSDARCAQTLTFWSFGGNDGKGGRVPGTDLVVFEDALGGQCYRLRTSIRDTIVFVFMNSSEQLHGNAPDCEGADFDKTCWSLRFITYGRQQVLDFVERRRRGDASGGVYWDTKVDSHRALGTLGKGGFNLKEGDKVSASFGRKLLAATILERDDGLHFHWHADGATTKCNRNQKIFSQHCSKYPDPHCCFHCNPPLS